MILYYHRSVTIGRPRVSFNISEVEFLRSLRFSFKQIASILGISRATLYRRLDEEGLSSNCMYSNMSYQNLDSYIISIKRSHPNDGECLLTGHLCRLGIIVPRSWLWASIHQLDPENTAARWSITVRRRIYHAEGPKSVWHVDGMSQHYCWPYKFN